MVRSREMVTSAPSKAPVKELFHRYLQEQGLKCAGHQVALQSGFLPTHHTMVLYGLCSSCRGNGTAREG